MVSESMILQGLPGWAWPTRTARTLHYFGAAGEPSLCRRYFAGAVEAFDWPREDLVTEKACCAACWQRAPHPTDRGSAGG